MEIILKFLLLWLLGSGVMIFLYARREIIANWQEPVLRRPVLIIESDDWGPGPASQAGILADISRLLENFPDSEGRQPVMTLGMVLATADGAMIKAEGGYQRQMISPLTHGPLLNAISNGTAKGVFDVQLHGMEHFWPPALMAASESDASVRTWLDRAPDASTEELPAPLQSRWVDASVLPARTLNDMAVRQAVKEEVAGFQTIFGCTPGVVVPPTFVWSAVVEQAWAAAGIDVIVTPGRRYETRDESGKPADAGNPVHNGLVGENGIVYMVRDVYFEPSLGHTAAQAQDALAQKVELGQPALFETHRFNFLGSDEQKDQSLEQIKSLLQGALIAWPSLAFLSTRKLASILKNRDPEWVELGLRRRLHVWIRRLGEFPRLRKLAWLTGWIVPAGLVWKLTG
ncbi:MAG: glycosyl hydrolase [Gammaproteobacteria bacterium]